MELAKKEKRKSTGRNKKPADEVRSVRVSFRVTENEHKELRQIVNTLGLNVGDFIRSKISGTKNVVINGVSLIASLDKIGTELGRSGNNINQLAKQANAINKAGKVDESIMSRFNMLFSDHIKAQQEVQTAIRAIIRAVKG